MTTDEETKEKPNKAPKVFITLPVAPQSLDKLLEITNLITQYTKSIFRRSSNPEDSFYPRTTLLALDDIRLGSFPDLVKEILKAPSQFIGESRAVITGFTRTDSGLLLMNLDFGSQIMEQRKTIAVLLQELRTGESPGEYGYSHFNKPLHITVDFNLTTEQHNVLKKLLKKYRLQSLKFGPLEMYSNTDWVSNHPLEIIKP